MRKPLTVMLATAIALSLTSAAAAGPRHGRSQARVARLTRQVAHLRAQLRGMTVARKRASASLAATTASLQSSQEQLGTAEQQIASLQNQVGALQGEVGSLQGQVANLQNQIASIPTPLAVAVEQVRREVAWADGGAASPPGQLVAQAAMDYTAGHVSTAAYGYLELVGAPLPAYGEDVSTILGGQAGICGHAARVFAAIVTHFGLAVRSVDFGYTDPNGTPDGHVAVEVLYAGAWHFYDPTFGQFWRDGSGNVLSIADVRAGLGTKQKDVASFTNLVEDAALGDDTWFETDPATEISIGKTPLT